MDFGADEIGSEPDVPERLAEDVFGGDFDVFPKDGLAGVFLFGAFAVFGVFRATAVFFAVFFTVFFMLFLAAFLTAFFAVLAFDTDDLRPAFFFDARVRAAPFPATLPAVFFAAFFFVLVSADVLALAIACPWNFKCRRIAIMQDDASDKAAGCSV